MVGMIGICQQIFKATKTLMIILLTGLSSNGVPKASKKAQQFHLNTMILMKLGKLLKTILI